MYDDGIEERGVPGGEGTRGIPDRTPADDGKRSEAEWTLYNAGIKREGGSGGRGYAGQTGWDAGGSVKMGIQKWIPILHDLGAILLA